jgi:uncharacterized protein YbjT (DUF2867 family)
MILVAGGTGRLGKQVVRLLVDAAEDVRVLTRDRAGARGLPDAIEIVTGDIRQAADVSAAVRGCKAVVSAVHGFVGSGSPSPEAIDRDGNAALIRAAKEAGVARFVLVSVYDARPDHPMSLHRAKYAAEEELRRSGLRFTIVRATSFLETWIAVIGGELENKGHALVFGPGKNPINFVSARDVARLVALRARDRSPSNEQLDIGGPEDLDFVTFAERLIKASGTRGRIKHVPLPALRAMSVLARPFSPMFARQAAAAVVMNTTEMTFDPSLRARLPALPATTLEEVLAGLASKESH